jgi:hypothetical protein
MVRDVEFAKRVYLQPAFLTCVAVLALAGGGMSLKTHGLGLLKKSPLPLKKSLELLDENGLGPYRVVDKSRIANNEVVKELGTEDYIQWVIEDTDAPVDSPVRRLFLFVTYYALPDRVPHVPEECWAGGGYQQRSSGRVSLSIDDKAGFRRGIGARCLVFGSSRTGVGQPRHEFPVLYFFRVNNEYAGSRNGARIALNKSAFQRFSCFSKVEFVFNQMAVGPTKGAAVAACEKLLGVVLPVLEREHWPDPQKAGSGG